MNRDCKDVYITILKRLQEICTRDEVDMWLTGSTALAAYRDGSLVCGDVSVCIYAKDALRLEKAVRAEADAGFDVESPLSNSKFRRNELRVFDPSTTDCDTSDFFRYDNNCMHVTVELIGQPGRDKNIVDRLAAKLKIKSGRSAGSFKKWCESQPQNATYLYFSKHNYRSDLFSHSRAVEIYGHSFFIPSDVDSFFSTQFGLGWQYLEFPVFENSSNHFIDSTCRWEDLIADVPAADIYSYERTLREYREGIAGHRDAQKVLTHVHNIVDQSYDRIQLYKKLACCETELKELAQKGRFDLIEEELWPYLTKLKKYYDIGLDLYVDDWVSEIVETLLTHKDMEHFAAEIRGLVPEGTKGLVLTDCRGEPLDGVFETDNQESAARKETASGGDLSETQHRLLNMMKRVHEFLSNNNIEYFLFGGSLLGAVRHGGFIPWDDDMDIVMDRRNYEKLLSVSDDLPWDDIAFDCCEKNPKFHKPFGMFTLLTDTRFVNDRIYFGGAGMGTGIDVFIMDNVPLEKLDEYLKTSLLFQELQSDETIQSADILKFKEDYLAWKAREVSEGKSAVVSQLKAELEKYGTKKPDDLQVVRLWTGKPRIYEAGMMEEPMLHKFEDAEFPIPNRAEECLKMQYGSDWNVVPPPESRQSHAFKIDYDLAACNYYRLVDNIIDWDEVSAALDKRKRNRLKHLEKKLAMDLFRKSLYLKAKKEV